MAHIASCMLEAEDVNFSLVLNNYIAKAVSPQASNESLETAPPSSEKPPHVWRMHQPERKYQLFPKDKQSAAAQGKSLDPEQAFALAMGQNGEKNEKGSSIGNGLRIRIKEHNLNRRRKISVPELGPMTTVQEVAMDSPTIPGYIPGRPTMHERSISAPGNHTWKHPHLAEFVAMPREQCPDEKAELGMTNAEAAKNATDLRQPLSPKSLAPLVIPTQSTTIPRLKRQLSLTRLRSGSGSTPVETAIRSARADDSPKAKTPFTPLSASQITPLSAASSVATSIMTASTLPTPISAPMESRSSPRPWEKSVTGYALVTTPKEITSESTNTPTPRAEPTESRTAPAMGHRRNQSESGSIMERGRPRKRSESSGNGTVLKRSASKRSKSAERRAFEQLPKGWKASDAVNMLSPSEVGSLQKQALQQAARFEILRKEDVDNLSRELRQLDERTEYLRRTYTSLRAGRRNLHTRICQYLRSPRTAKFSHESMLKQEEALAELDASIDDWVTKLEQAENRRTRVRQKLLEHVAAAATLPSLKGDVSGVSESLHLAMGVRPPHAAGNISTPPRSPTKVSSTHNLSSSPSPQRVVAQVPSTILEQPVFEDEAAVVGLGLTTTTDAKVATTSSSSTATTLRRAETIRIYADNDVYALLADVENEISKMGCGELTPVKERSPMSVADRKHLHRKESHEALVNGNKKATSPSGSATSGDEKTNTSSTNSPSLSLSSSSSENVGEVFLTNAVFRG